MPATAKLMAAKSIASQFKGVKVLQGPAEWPGGGSGQAWGGFSTSD